MAITHTQANLNPCGHLDLMRPRSIVDFGTIQTVFLFTLSTAYFSFLFTSALSFRLRIGPPCFQAGLNLGYNLFRFILLFN